MQRNYFVVGLIMFIFFIISFLTNIMGPLIPEIIQDFKVSKGMAAFLPFAFFVAYGVFSIPSGIAIDRYKEKWNMLVAFAVASVGAILFSLFPSFPVALVSLFLIGSGMAMLQVAINPLLRVSGGEEHFAFNSVMAQLVFGAASFLSPQLYSYLVVNLEKYNESTGASALITTLHHYVPGSLPWVSLYWIFAVVTLLMVLLIWAIKLPDVKLTEEESAGSWKTYLHLFGNRTVFLFFIGIFAYVGTEQGIANWISQFLKEYHGYDPQVQGANAITWFWGLLTIGCLLGMGLLKIMDSKLVLRIFTILAMITLTISLLGPAKVALWGFPMVGFFLSVMWSIIFSLALNSIKEHHGSFSGILCSGIIGGAVVPLIVGTLSDQIGLRGGMTFIYLTMGYILSISFWARPLIKNKTIFSKQ
jgi:MFS transporter, FHS family, L-fucose permease